MTTKQYLHGLYNHHQTEALPNVLVAGHNSPQQIPYGLYAEQISGSAFTAPRHTNLHTWFYRIHPSVLHSDFQPLAHETCATENFNQLRTPPTQMRWNPIPYPTKDCTFIQGLFTFAGHGSPATCTGAAIHLYTATRSMENEYFYNADGELLIVPQEGTLQFKTECGYLEINPGEIAVIPRGIKFQVLVPDGKARGYICENFGTPFRLPELGVIGANGLANPRDFIAPTASYEEKPGALTLIAKFQGHLWQAEIKHSPLDVVAWHGNYFPYKYDLSLFNTMGTVSFDHPDPSIFTVLTAPSAVPGTANIDFVIFPPRWMVANETFRPPYYHRNVMNEFMGLICGIYDAKESGFTSGGCSLHNCMSAHGPDADAHQKATTANLKPEYYDNTLAFMFESQYVWHLTPQALNAAFRQKDYLECWQGLKSQFDACHPER